MNLKITLFIIAIGFLKPTVFSQETSNTIQWHTFEEAVKLCNENPKPLFIDVYTDWCGWCKRMDATTFKDEKVAAFLQANYYCVKLNAEQKEDIEFQGKKYVFVNQGRSGYHQIAAMLLDSQMSYPTMAIVSPEFKRTKLIIGYQDVGQLLRALK